MQEHFCIQSAFTKSGDLYFAVTKMVFYFTSSECHLLYMGKDKFENEDLIKYGWPEDVWFHVDKYSSAHVYVRLPEGMTADTMSEELIADCCQLVKANSIEGCKMKNVDIVYTPWSNLLKTKSMEVGQVSFHSSKKVKKCTVEKENAIVNRLNKTKREVVSPDLAGERMRRDKAQRQKERAQKAEEFKEQQEKIILARQDAELRSYDRILHEEDMVSNALLSNMTAEEYEDDFM